MLWILLALTGALANAAYFIIIKKNIRHLRPQVLTAVGFSLGGLLLFLFSAFRGFPVLGQDFFIAVIITTVLNIAGLTLIFAALSSSDLSLSVPMLSFTPAFLIGTSYLLLHELPSVFGIFGICIIVCGSYVLNISEQHNNFTDPVWSMIRNRGSWYMLIVAFLFSISINFDKIVLINSDPIFGMALTVSLIGWSFFLMSACPFVARWDALQHQHPGDPVPTGQDKAVSTWGMSSYTVPVLLIGLFVAIEAASINMAYTLQIVPYVIAIKRMSIIFMVLYGTIVFSEHEIKIRLAGAGLMVIGAVIILLFA
jgi:drug/metabolite transporter (DMT)-like permease